MQFLSPIRIEEDDSELNGESFAVEFEVLAPETGYVDSYKSEIASGIDEADKRNNIIRKKLGKVESIDESEAGDLLGITDGSD